MSAALAKIESAVNNAIGKDELEVLIRRESITGLAVLGMPASVIGKLHEAGMHLITKADIVKEYKYSACVNAASVDDRVIMLGEYSSTSGYMQYKTVLVYKGYIPEWALINMSAAVKAGIKYITIHSNEPLVVDEHRIITDPVLLGWAEDPDILVNPQHEYPIYESQSTVKQVINELLCNGPNIVGTKKVQRRTYAQNEKALAVLIAVWDEHGESQYEQVDKEYEDLLKERGVIK